MSASNTSPFIRLLTLFGIAATASFATSTLFNGLLFWAAWRINFYMVASTQDVILGGFAIAVRTALYSTGVFIGLFLFARLLNALSKRLFDNDNFWWEDYRAAVSGTAVIAVLLSVPLSLWPFAWEHPKLWSLRHARVESPIVYRTGLRVAPESEVSTFCRNGDVLWMGSASAVLKCANRVLVLHGREGLITELTTDTPVIKR